MGQGKSLLMVVAASIALCSCGGGAPKGQVVAKIDKDEITVLDLQTEMNGYVAPNPQARKAAEQAALNAIIQRKLVVRAAEEQKLTKSPEFARAKERAEELFVVSYWQDRLAKAVPTPSKEEARKFVTEHPDLYSARKVIGVEGIAFAGADKALIDGLRPLKTLDEVRALLVSRNIPHGNRNAQLDALQADPRMVEQLLKLPPNEVFVIPQNNQILVGRVAQVNVAPVPDNIAMQHATQYLKATRTREAIGRNFGSITTAGRKDVEYNKAYEPPKTAPAGKAAPPAKAAPAEKPA